MLSELRTCRPSYTVFLTRSTLELPFIPPPSTRFSILQDPADTSSAGTRTGGAGGGVTFGSSRHLNTSSSSNSNNGRPSLLSLGAALRRQNEDTALKVLTLQRSGVGTVTVLRKMEAAVHALSTKDLFWKVRSQ